MESNPAEPGRRKRSAGFYVGIFTVFLFVMGAATAFLWVAHLRLAADQVSAELKRNDERAQSLASGLGAEINLRVREIRNLGRILLTQDPLRPETQAALGEISLQDADLQQVVVHELSSSHPPILKTQWSHPGFSAPSDDQFQKAALLELVAGGTPQVSGARFTGETSDPMIILSLPLGGTATAPVYGLSGIFKQSLWLKSFPKTHGVLFSVIDRHGTVILSSSLPWLKAHPSVGKLDAAKAFIQGQQVHGLARSNGFQVGQPELVAFQQVVPWPVAVFVESPESAATDSIEERELLGAELVLGLIFLAFLGGLICTRIGVLDSPPLSRPPLEFRNTQTRNSIAQPLSANGAAFSAVKLRRLPAILRQSAPPKLVVQPPRDVPPILVPPAHLPSLKPTPAPSLETRAACNVPSLPGSVGELEDELELSLRTSVFPDEPSMFIAKPHAPPPFEKGREVEDSLILSLERRNLNSELTSPDEPSYVPTEKSTTILVPQPEPVFNMDLVPIEETKPPKEWYYLMEGEVLGPFSEDETRQGMISGDLSPEMLISEDREGPWVAVKSLAQFTVKPGAAA